MSHNSPETKKISLIGSAFGKGAGDHGCKDGVEALQKLGVQEWLQERGYQAKWDSIVTVDEAFPRDSSDLYWLVAKNSELTVETVKRALREHSFPLILGGDHSIALGTWTGVSHTIGVYGMFGLIWLDAHMDSHTHETNSPSGNIHGMSLSALMGYGHPDLLKVGGDVPKIDPSKVCIIGARSYEEGEHELLKKLGVKIIYMEDIHKRGFKETFQEAVDYVNKGTLGFGLSLDLDVFSPDIVPGVGSPAPNGLSREDMKVLSILKDDKRLRALEVVEYNPHNDIENKTAQIVHEILNQIF